MHPELITFPGGFSIKTYGFCLMVGFLSAVWLAMRRAARVKVDPDKVLDVSFIALLAGVGCSRAFYVIHYWKSQYADAPNPFWAVIDLRQGGLEFLGGLLGAMFGIIVYLLIKKQSVRLFLDVLAPGAMWGLAFGRIGCFFNGCCFGGVCTLPNSDHAKYPWAMTFPYGSPAHIRQWEERQVTLPAELITAYETGLAPWPLSESLLSMSPERRGGPRKKYEDAVKEQEQTQSKITDVAAQKEIMTRLKSLKAAWEDHERELFPLRVAETFPSRISEDRKSTVSELQDLAAVHRSLPVHPSQLYAAMSALLLSGLLSAVFYRRKRHGVVIGLLAVLYPISRVLEEMIRVDNPRDVGLFTVSQFISITMAVAGLVYLWILYKWLPERSPAANAAAVDSNAKD